MRSFRDPARLRRRLTLEAPAEIPDGAGGVVRSYSAIGGLAAEVTPLALDEQVRAERLGPRVTHRLVVRRRADLTTQHRLRDGPRVWRIVAIAGADPAGRYLELAAVEET